MTLEEALIARWASSPALAALLPVERLSTGPAHRTRPLAVLSRGPTRTLARTNAGDVLDEVEVAFHVWHDDHASAAAVVEEIAAAYDRAAFDLGGRRRVLRMLRTGETAAPRGDGAWEFVVAFTLRVQR